MKRAAVPSILVAVVLLALGVTARAQQPAKIPRRIYFIRCLPVPTSPARIEAFLQGLRDLGYIEGQNLIIEYRYAEGKVDRLPDLAAELVRLKVDAIFCTQHASSSSCQEGDDNGTHCQRQW